MEENIPIIDLVVREYERKWWKKYWKPWKKEAADEARRLREEGE